MRKSRPSSIGPDAKSKRLLDLIRIQGITSKQELMETCRFPMSTISRSLEELIRLRLIREAGFGESKGGRKPILYEINPDYANVLGLEVSRTHSRLLLFDFTMNKKAEQVWEMNQDTTPEHLAAAVVSAIMGWRNLYEPNGLLGMGVGAVGPLDKEKGIILNPVHFASPGWREVPLRQMLEEQLNLPVIMENGANTALLGEFATRQYPNLRHFLYVHAGMGLRSSMISDEKLVTGALDMESAIGQMIIQSDGCRLEAYGNYGALESYASIAALEQFVRSSLKQGRESELTQCGRSADQVTYPQILEALRREDALAKEAFVRTAVFLGIGLANMINILHPEAVILGGPLITSNTIVFETAARTAEGKIHHQSVYRPEFYSSRLAEAAGATGAALLVIEQPD